MIRRLRVAVIGALALAAGLALTPTAGAASVASIAAGASAVNPAKLSGVVTDAVTGQPIPDACTDDTGAWTMSGVTAGTAYLLDASADGYADQVYKGKYDINDGTPVTAPAVVDFQLTHPGDLVGSVHNADGSVPTDLYLSADRLGEANASFSGSVDPTTGAFDIAVPAGNYIIDFESGPFHLYAPGTTKRVAAQSFSVQADGTTTVGALTFPAGETISGTITSAATGQPLEGMCAYVFPADQPNSGDFQEQCAGSDGTYQVRLATPGRYRVEFIDPNGSYAFQYFPHAVGLTPPTVLTLGTGASSVRTGVDAALEPGAVITGRAVDALTGQPIKQACASGDLGRSTIYPYGEGGTCSGAGGRFTVTGLAARSYLVEVGTFNLTTYAPSSSTPAGARLYTTKVGQTLNIGDVKVAPGGTVSGVVTDALTGQPIPDVIVGLSYGPRVGDGGAFSSTTDATGHYTIDHMPAGAQKLVAWTFDPAYAPSWSGGAPDPSLATPATVTDGGSTTANFALTKGGTISGRVVDAAGHPVTKPYILEAYSVSSPTQDLGLSSDVTKGVFTIQGLPNTPVVLAFSGTHASKILFYYDAAKTRAAATLVTVGPGATTTITAHVP